MPFPALTYYSVAAVKPMILQRHMIGRALTGHSGIEIILDPPQDFFHARILFLLRTPFECQGSSSTGLYLVGILFSAAISFRIART